LAVVLCLGAVGPSITVSPVEVKVLRQADLVQAVSHVIGSGVLIGSPVHPLSQGNTVLATCHL
jgi:hypothetical protein